jgi:predicted secreted hydrolase
MSRWLSYSIQRATVCSVCVLLVLLSSCAFPGIVTTSQQLPEVPQATQERQLPPVRFPDDEGTHNNLTEWWYYTGHLEAKSTDGKPRRYGFELVVFQILRGNVPPVYAAHFAISDLTRGEFHYDQRRIMRPTATPGRDQHKGINLHVGDWFIQGLNGHDRLSATMKDYSFALNLSDQKSPVLHNEKGLITYGLAGFSYYYSRTRMAVTGTIQDRGQSLQVTGMAWMDHQWGDFLTLAGSGWDWYSLQLENNTEIMLYFIRDASGKALATYIGYIDEKGRNSVIPPSALHASVLEQWRSPTTGIIYPSGWRLDINDARLKATLTVVPQLRDQELVVLQSTGNTYWEGAVMIQGKINGRPLKGAGYVELTGYTR